MNIFFDVVTRVISLQQIRVVFESQYFPLPINQLRCFLLQILIKSFSTYDSAKRLVGNENDWNMCRVKWMQVVYYDKIMGIVIILFG